MKLQLVVKTGYGVCNAFGIPVINMGLIGIPDHHVPQFIHLNVECKLLEQDRIAKQRDLVIGFELGFAWWL